MANSVCKLTDAAKKTLRLWYNLNVYIARPAWSSRHPT